MDHADHVQLLRGGVGAPGGIWADLGAGSGAFTLALRELLGSDATIYAVDRDAGALRRNEAAMQVMFPGGPTVYQTADFTRPLDLPDLDGIVIANALHFQHDQIATVRNVGVHLKPGGRILVVEYNTDRPSGPVP